MLKALLEQNMVSIPHTRVLGTPESAATTVKSEPLPSDAACTRVTPNNNILEQQEAEEPSTEEPKNQCETEWDCKDFTSIKIETGCISRSVTSSEFTQNDVTMAFDSEDSDTDNLPLSIFKNEPTTLDYIDENCSGSLSSEKIDLQPLDDSKINNAIVYTTRLDEMRFFNDCTFNHQDHIQNIILESKPNIKFYNMNCPRTAHASYISFKNLVKKLNTINMNLNRSHKWKQKAKVDSIQSSNTNNTLNLNEHSRNLLKTCKPLIILLENLILDDKNVQPPTKNDRDRCRQMKKKKKNEKKKLKTKDTSLTHKSVTDIPKEIEKKYDNRSSKAYDLLILQNIKTNEQEMYLIDVCGSVWEYYRNTESEINLYKPFLDHKIPKQTNYRLREFCCWYKREDLLKSLCASKYLFILPFLKAGHDCTDLISCSCCCKPFLSIDSQSDEPVLKIDESSSYQLKNILQSLCTDHNQEESLFINSAMMYTPKTLEQPKKSLKVNQTDTAILHLRNAKILIKNIKTDENEYYELEANGEVVTHLKPYIYKRCQVQDELSYISQTGIKYFTYCCWFRRESILKKLASIKVSPNTLTYMKTSHGCSLQNCLCCCKFLSFENIKKRPVSKIITSASSIHTNNKSTLVTIEYDKPSPHLMAKPMPATKTNPVVDLTNTTSLELITNDNSSNSNKTFQVSCDASIKHKPEIKTNVISMQQNKAMNAHPSEPNKTGSIDDITKVTLQRITNSIMNKFNNARFEMNNENKVIATINSTEAELSNADITSLGKIISFAQEEINRVKIADKSNVNTLNVAANTSAIQPELKKVKSKLNDSNNDVSKESTTIKPNDKSNRTTSYLKSTKYKLKDKMYGDFTSLYYANRVHSLSALSQLKKDMLAPWKSKMTIDTTSTIKPSSQNNTALTTFNETKKLKSGSLVNHLKDTLTDEITDKTNPQISNQTLTSNTSHGVQPSQPGPVHCVFAKIPQPISEENNDDVRISVYTHKKMKRSHNIADKHENKRPCVEQNQIIIAHDVNNEQISNNAAMYQPMRVVQQPYLLPYNNVVNTMNYQYLPPLAPISHNSLGLNPKIVNMGGDMYGNPVIISHSPLVENSIVFLSPELVPQMSNVAGVVPNLHPLTGLSIQPLIVKVEDL